jgi:heme exporter protein D
MGVMGIGLGIVSGMVFGYSYWTAIALIVGSLLLFVINDAWARRKGLHEIWRRMTNELEKEVDGPSDEEDPGP